jgi:hypothetical protein
MKSIISKAELERKIEINGAEWRVRATAAFKTFDLIVGDADTWNRYLQSIGHQQNIALIEQANCFQPAIFALREVTYTIFSNGTA